MKTKRFFALILSVLLVVAMIPAMAFAEEAAVDTAADTTAATDTKSDDIVILTTNDVHCAINGDNIGYAGLAAYKKEMEAVNKYVTLVDAGDAIQGGVVGTLSKGEYLTEIMNSIGYEIAVPGNHEFDYGMEQFLNKIVPAFKGTYLSCNFVDAAGKPVFDAYKIVTYGDKKVAYVGICTPETFTKSTPTYFQNSKGEYIYGFCQGNNGKDLYDAVQKAVDAAKKAGADYVVAVGHLGIDDVSSPWTSTEVIQNTTGIDAFVDGHSHSIFAGQEKNKDGKVVATISTGTKLENIGKVTISAKGVVTTALVPAAEVTEKDADTEALISEIEKKNEALVNTVVAKSDVDLITHDADGNRLIRSEETNLGDLCADAYRIVLGADIGFMNGGGIRANIEKGDITYGDIIEVFPYGNSACVVEATGQQILDALEMGARSAVSENGGFQHVSGLTYTINPFIPSSVELDETGAFVKVNGEYRVSNVKVAGQPLDLEKTYTLASHNYMLKKGGDGFTMFKGCKILQDEVMIDNQLLISYIQEKLKGKVGEEYAQPQGRISIVSVEAIEALTQKLAIAEYECKASIKQTKLNGKKALKVSWNTCTGVDSVKYQVWKSTKSASGFKRVITTSKTSYTTTSVTKGKTYYFKVRAYKSIDGKAYYGHWSNKVYKKVA